MLRISILALMVILLLAMTILQYSNADESIYFDTITNLPSTIGARITTETKRLSKIKCILR